MRNPAQKDDPPIALWSSGNTVFVLESSSASLASVWMAPI